MDLATGAWTELSKCPAPRLRSKMASWAEDRYFIMFGGAGKVGSITLGFFLIITGLIFVNVLEWGFMFFNGEISVFVIYYYLLLLTINYNS
jgi:hypothetical protein